MGVMTEASSATANASGDRLSDVESSSACSFVAETKLMYGVWSSTAGAEACSKPVSGWISDCVGVELASEVGG